MKNTVAAASPLLIALVAGTAIHNGVLTESDVSRLRVELARPGVIQVQHEPVLDEHEQELLAEHNPFGVPLTTLPGSRTLIVREGYTLLHNNVDLIADWVSYHLTRAYVNGDEERPGSSAFQPDPELMAGRRAELSDYAGWARVYDRGHQASNADSRGRGMKVVLESFYLSNMTPQSSTLNQQRWRLLEDRIQNLARDRGELWVITGPAFVDLAGDGVVKHLAIGKDLVAVPTHYFKIVYVRSEQGVDAMAFLIPNEPLTGQEFDVNLVSIDEIEKVTGYDFLSGLEDTVEDSIEELRAFQVWQPKESAGDGS